MEFPKDSNLPTHLLASCFDSTSATYKYYWFLSILDSLSENKTVFPKKELFSRMVAIPWYTVNYFQVSFGKQDVIHREIENIRSFENISIDEDKNTIVSKLIRSQNSQTQQALYHFDNQVPHWFLSPWFRKNKSRQYIYSGSKDFENECLYGLYQDRIELNPNWLPYLIKNVRFLKDFCLWNLAVFLQKRNPGVPEIPSKLVKPASRNPLTSQRNNFWNLVFDELGEIECIYTHEKLTRSNYEVEHFIPYSYVCHDLMWNLVPADPIFNSRKSNKLPKLEDYFDGFYKIQKQAIEVILSKKPNSKYLLDYLFLFKNLDEIEELPTLFDKDRLREAFQPLILMAHNNGFQYLSRNEK
ncbi:MAG: HNH endonuclease domain-containing protein [Mongoliitalea sp.]